MPSCITIVVYDPYSCQYVPYPTFYRILLLCPCHAIYMWFMPVSMLPIYVCVTCIRVSKIPFTHGVPVRVHTRRYLGTFLCSSTSSTCCMILLSYKIFFHAMFSADFNSCHGNRQNLFTHMIPFFFVKQLLSSSCTVYPYF